MAFVSISVRFLGENDKSKIIVVTQRLDIEYWKIFASGAKAAFNDFGIDGKVMAPDSLYPITNQPNLLKQVLEQRPDALIVSPTHPAVASPVLMEYKKKNIPVFLTTTDAEWYYQTAYVGTDNFTLGKTAGELLGSMLQPGDQVAIIFGGIIDRKKGAKKALEDAGMEVVIEVSGYDQFRNPKSRIETILQNYPNIKGVIATTDRIALEELKVIEEKALKIPVIGTDGLIEMVQFVKTGRIKATIAQNPYDAGYLSVEQAQKAIKDGTVEKRVDSGIDIITEDNAKEKLGFLKKILH